MGRVGEQWGVAFLLFFLCSGGSAGIARAEEKATREGKPGANAPGSSLVDSLSLTSQHAPIHISSRTLEFRYEEKRIIYRDDVVAVQGDVTMKSDLLTVTYEDVPPSNPAASDAKGKTVEQSEKQKKSTDNENATAKQRLKEIIAEGHVEIISGDRRATGKKAVFDEAQRIVVLSGDAAMQEGGNRVTGERVTVYLDEKRSVVDGGGGSRRAEMVLVPQQEGEEKKGAKKP
ncbi:MAG: LptA/OstA family protein [Candidatus Binatia bacterium]